MEHGLLRWWKVMESSILCHTRSERQWKHKIDVAVGNSPLGPFKPARTDGTPLITDSMTRDSHRWNADIDPTVWMDEDGTPWLAWGNGDCYMVKLKKT